MNRKAFIQSILALFTIPFISKRANKEKETPSLWGNITGGVTGNNEQKVIMSGPNSLTVHKGSFIGEGEYKISLTRGNGRPMEIWKYADGKVTHIVDGKIKSIVYEQT